MSRGDEYGMNDDETPPCILHALAMRGDTPQDHADGRNPYQRANPDAPWTNRGLPATTAAPDAVNPAILYQQSGLTIHDDLDCTAPAAWWAEDETA